MANNRREINVYADWNGIEGPVLMGHLYAEHLKGKEIFSFEYHKDWLSNPAAQNLDPDLQLFGGPQYLNTDKENFGLFMDSSPDRWGKLLMRRREAALARKENHKPQKLFATDYLLGVYDEHRMGALRFKIDSEGEFLNNNKEMAAPPMTSLRELEAVSLKLEEEDAANDPEYLHWLNLLIAPGSSLGGARPKASVQDKNQHLWIAKFPSKNDSVDIGAWEQLANNLASQTGITMAEGMIQKYNGPFHTYLSKRFDRTSNHHRLHFASALTLLGHTDGYDAAQGASYLELAEFIMSNGAEVNKDLVELWKRIVFSICISNTDDHMRNHGFILTSAGWRLSPAYDINPVANSAGLSLNISEDDNALELDLAIEVAPFFRLSHKKAEELSTNIKEVTSNWQSLAIASGISHNEIELMSSAFLK